MITPTELYVRDWEDAEPPPELSNEVSAPWTSERGHVLVAIEHNGITYVVARSGDQVTNCWRVK